MRTLLICINSIDDTQRALVEVLNDGEYKVIMSGDEYHDKIIEKVEGFFQALIPEFFEMVNEYEKKMKYARSNSSLPDNPDYKKINEFVASVNERVVKGEI